MDSGLDSGVFNLAFVFLQFYGAWLLFLEPQYLNRNINQMPSRQS